MLSRHDLERSGLGNTQNGGGPPHQGPQEAGLGGCPHDAQVGSDKKKCFAIELGKVRQ